MSKQELTTYNTQTDVSKPQVYNMYSKGKAKECKQVIPIPNVQSEMCLIAHSLPRLQH